VSDDPLLPPHGGYRGLKAYQNSEVIHDATVVFCRRFLKPTDRTVDQMVQAARSGKQNIAEGSSISGTSKVLELKLIGVARGSLEELLNDYQDFLRQQDLERWPKDSEKAIFIRRLAYQSNLSFEIYRTYVETKTAETAANTILCLTMQTCFLLDRLKTELGNRLLSEGGLTEKISRERRKLRGF
jgi:restriction system protein